MKKQALFIVLFGLAAFSVFSQSYIGYVTQTANLRQGPGTDYGVITALGAGSTIFIVSAAPQNDFYNVIDVASNTEGYLHRSFARLVEEVEPIKGEVFSYGGSGDLGGKVEIEIFNNTRLRLSVKIDDKIFTFSPNETKTISIESGSINFRASAPGVLPAIGREHLSRNSRYSWEFYISSL
jgi:hypothetical protein